MILPLLPADEANEAVVKLHNYCSALEQAVKVATRFCHLKQSGFCYDHCAAAPFCGDRESLHLLSYGELPSKLKRPTP